MEDQPPDSGIVQTCTAAIVCAYVRNNPVPVGNLPALIRSVRDLLHKLHSSASFSGLHRITIPLISLRSK
jgi:predicted transcriptional regulator